MFDIILKLITPPRSQQRKTCIVTRKFVYIHLKQTRIPFGQIKATTIEKNSREIDEDDEQTHKNSQR